MTFKMYKNLFFVFVVLAKTSASAQNYYEQAYNQYFNGNDDKISVELFTKAIENNQDLAKSYMYRGAAKTYLSDYIGAAMDIKQSIRLDSNDYKVYYYYGKLYFAQGFFETALRQYNIAISKNSKDADVFDFRAIAKMRIGDFRGAMEDEELAIGINPLKADFFNNRGYAKLELKEYQSAIDDFDLALKKGNTPRSYANKGNALAALGKYKEAIEVYTIALEKMPKAKDVNYFRGLSYQKIGEKTQACKDFAKSAEMGFEPASAALKENCAFK